MKNRITQISKIMLMEKKKEAKSTKFILTDINFLSNINYINISRGQAPEAKLASHLSHKQGLDGHPGSIPYSSSDFGINVQNTKVKTFGWGASALISLTLKQIIKVIIKR